MTESKHDAFLRLAQKRTRRVLNRIRILSHCANSYAYEYSEEEVRKIFEAIDEELDAAKAKFGTSRKREFRFQ